MVQLDGKLYTAYDEGGVPRIIGEYADFRVGRVFFYHSYKGGSESVIGELKDLKPLLRPNSMLIPTAWNGFKWITGITNECLLPKKTWSFKEQRWLFD